ncbi:hypothetical protein RUM44_012212 [Polyplax serrata]|uniref:Uncharacterized protein n=1 Tax=Polyplax serrata TaxID=468196 RepID=A0ABR1BEL1_POLSC
MEDFDRRKDKRSKKHIHYIPYIFTCPIGLGKIKRMARELESKTGGEVESVHIGRWSEEASSEEIKLVLENRKSTEKSKRERENAG